MARLFPKIEPAEIQNPGERAVAQALVSQLRSNIEVFHSFNWLGATARGTVVEGECDFVILDPENGVLFVEVKGGSLEFDADNHQWVRVTPRGERRILQVDPFQQVQRSMHELVERIGRQFPGGAEQLPFTYGFAVAFPDCRYTGALPPSIMPDLVFDAARCADMAASVQRAFDRFRRRAHAPLPPRQVESVHEALFPRFAILPVVWRRVEDQEERLRRLTTEQQRLLEFLGARPLAAIRGVAGSGKTILALAKAQEMARRGLRTVFLCYNRPLKDWLLLASSDSFGESLTIDTYHGLVNDFCRKASIPFRPQGDAFWTDRAPEYLMQATECLGEEHKFDAVIVDEGQDFQDLWWTSLDTVFRDPARKPCYYVFYDPNQNIYVDAPSIPSELGPPFELPINCRNTVRIAEHCAALVGADPHSREGAPLGDVPEIIQFRGLRDAFREAGRRVRIWCMPNAGGLKTSRVAVLAAGSTERDWPRDFDTIPATRDLDRWRSGSGVLVSSWARFKGLEADAVIIIDTAAPGDRAEAANRYVARSRAKHLLLVLQVEQS